MNRLTRVFRPLNLDTKSAFNLPFFSNKKSEDETTCRSYKLFLNYGIIRRSSTGMYHLLPMGQRAMQKLISLVDQEMKAVGAQKIVLNSLTNQRLWEKAGTFDRAKDDLYTIKDRGSHPFILSPTHEEAIAALISHEQLSYKNFPLLLYQVTSKYRDELRPKLGLIRSKEFVMKDLYSFDIDEESAASTYKNISNSYERIFKKLEVPFYKVKNGPDEDTVESHEYYYLSEIGDEKLYSCIDCKYTCNEAAMFEQKTLCPGCKGYLKKESNVNGIEIAHTFKFSTSRYAIPLNAKFISKEQNKLPLQMCSYGIGLSRVLAATVELMSSGESIKWPRRIVPYTVCLIPPKEGSNEAKLLESTISELYSQIESMPKLNDDVILDDRGDKTIGKRLIEAKAFGFPFIIIAGKDAVQQIPTFELHDLREDKKLMLGKSQLLKYLLEHIRPLFDKPDVAGLIT